MDIMKTLSGVQLCFVLLCLAACMAECKEPKRSKLSSDFGLTPFLRSGRGSEHSWDANVDVKRKIGKMVSFPRIGRSESWGADENNYGAKRPGANSGMWFGPRLGRVQKRSDEYTPWTYIIVNGEGPVTRQVHYTPRLGRESEEVYDDLDAEDVA
ncbi:uncharacterized protein LOC135124449 [Zophobas morio]|nr:capa [Zophobas atratus]